jgi:hypothetical protein
MSKRCIPGVICVENITLAIFFFLFVVLAYLYYIFLVKVSTRAPTQVYMAIPGTQSSQGIVNAGSPNILMDPYAPPERADGYNFPTYARSGVPVNIETRGLSQSYTQMGILTRKKDDLILTLMGRRLLSGLDKWQYYTISNTGNMNTKLPIKVRGRNCSGEYGCDCLMSGDNVYVEGYSDIFKATVYENNLFNYIPF